MFSNQHSTGKSAWGLVCLLIILFVPTSLRAEQYVIRNETPVPVVVQATCIFQGQAKRDRPIPLKPGAIMPPMTWIGKKVITVYDARVPTRVLYRGMFPPSIQNVKLSIRPSPLGGVTMIPVP